ncbi:MAG TPA: polyhydroxyalkanoic acid system family protein [Myxococcota bacterium]|nr:polyhydroxyalkanoic acid system family protein [Myxococcota bacterium]
MKHRIPHDLPLDTARTLTRNALESYREQFPEYSPRGNWESEDVATLTFTVMGNTLIGRVEVHPSTIELELTNIPLLFRPFRTAALEVIECEIREWIERAKQGKEGM